MLAGRSAGGRQIDAPLGDRRRGALTHVPYWPCESNSVCLGSAPRAPGASVAYGLSAGVLASRASPTSVLPYLASPPWVAMTLALTAGAKIPVDQSDPIIY